MITIHSLRLLAGLALFLTLPNRLSQAEQLSSPQVIIQRGHAARVEQLTFSAGGRLLFSRGQDQSVKLWDMSSRLLLRTFPIGAGEVAASDDGQWLATSITGLDCDQVAVWDTLTGMKLSDLLEQKTAARDSIRVFTIAFEPNSSRIAFGVSYTTGLADLMPKRHIEIRICEVPSGREITRLAYSADQMKALDLVTPVTRAVFSPDGRRLYVGTRGAVHVWDVTSQKLISTWTFPPEDKAQFAAAICPSVNGRWLAVSVHDVFTRDPDSLNEYEDTPTPEERIVVFDTATGKIERTIPVTNHRVYALGFDDLAEQVLAGTVKGVSAWNLTTGERKELVKDPSGWGAPVFAVAPDHGFLASAGVDRGAIRVYDPQTGDHLFDFPTAVSPVTEPIAVAADGRRMLIVHNGALFEVDLGADLPLPPNGTDRYRNNVMRRIRLSDSTTFKAVAYDGNIPLAAYENGIASHELKLWTEEKELDLTKAKPEETLGECHFSKDGKSLIAAKHARNGDQTFEFIKTSPPEKVGTFGPFDSLTVVLRVLSIPRPLALISRLNGNAVELWDPSKPQPLWRIRAGNEFIADTIGDIVGMLDTDRAQITLWGADLSPAQAPTPRPFETLKGKRPQLTFVDSSTSQLHVMLEDGSEKSLDSRTFKSLKPSDIPLIRALGTDAPMFLIYGTQAPNGAGAFSGSDGTVHLTNARAGAEVARFIFASEPNETDPAADFILLLPDGHYAANVAATSKVAFAIGDAAFPFEAFDLSLNRPDIVFRRFGFVPAATLARFETAFRMRLDRIKVTPEQAAIRSDWTHLPQVRFISASPFLTDERIVKLNVRCQANAFPLKDVATWVNDVPLKTLLSVHCDAGKSVVVPLDVSLTSGLNVVDVAVTDSHGATSLRRRISIISRAKSETHALYAAAIGISDYAGHPLDCPAKDAKDLADFFNHAGRFQITGTFVNLPPPDLKYGYSAIHTKVVVNQEVTKGAFRRLRDFFQDIRPDDTAILFLAGHGFRQNGQYYFLTSDADFDHPAETGLSYDSLEQFLDSIPCRQKILLLDSCQAGEAPPGAVGFTANIPGSSGHVIAHAEPRGVGGTTTLKAPPIIAFGPGYDDVFRDIRPTIGSVVIAASGGMEVAWEQNDRIKNGLFTYAILDGLYNGKADLDRDGRVTVGELKRYVDDTVATLSQGQQHPSERRGELARDFTLLTYPRLELNLGGKK